MALDLVGRRRRRANASNPAQPSERKAAPALAERPTRGVRRGPAGEAGYDDFDIQVVGIDGRGLHTVTRTRDWDIDAQWSPSGKWLAFTRSPPSPTDCSHSTVWLVRPSPKNAHRVADGCQARWSPDGKRLVMTSRSGTELQVVAVATGRTRTVHRTSIAGAFISAAAWSDKRRQILFTLSLRDGGARFGILDLSRGSAKTIGRGFAAAWSPDGSKILYTSRFEGPLFVIGGDGTGKRSLGLSGAEPDWG
ncbi:MAG TPA: hypothetical protein VFA56_08775 [Gaiellaceae bacterium]|nr:hypothetical protein [Gaiellaceae bacterium]